MARVNEKSFEEGRAAEIMRPTDHCFYCGHKLVGFPFVFWRGNDEKGQEIWLHIGCARKLSEHLAEDSKKEL